MPPRRRLPGPLPCLLLLAAATACQSGPERLDVRRLPGTWRHCEAARDGEQRPADWCPHATLLAAAADAPLDGEAIVAAVPEGARTAGPVVVAREAFGHAAPAPDSLDAALLRGNVAGLSRGTRDDGLLRVARAMPLLQPVLAGPALSWHDGVPATVTLPVRRGDDRPRATWAAWAWSGARARDTVALGPTPLPADARIALGFAVGGAGEAPGSPPVRFRLLAGDTVLWERTLDPAAREADRGWQDAEVPAGAFAGTTTPLTLAADAAHGVSFPLWAQPAVVSRPPVPARRPNVVLLSLDTVRADHLSLYGYGIPTSPTLDAFAAGGTVFSDAFSTFPSTTASHMSMLTGVPPCEHGVIVPSDTTLVLPAGLTTLAQAFSAGGWTTLAVTEDALIHGPQGFDRGFDRYVDQVPEPGLGLFARGIARALSWLPARDDRPFFLFLHTYQAHVPYKVPPHVRARFPVPEGGSDAERQRVDYDAGLVYTDELLGGLLRGLAERGLLEDTLVVITSDHGTAFGEHGGIGHALGVHDEQVHVPLVFHDPGLADAGRRVDVPVSLVDLAPTLLDAAGVARPDSMPGTSLVPFLRGRTPEAAPSPVFAENLWGRRDTLWRTATHAWITTAAGTAVFDLAADPGEQHDRAAADPALARRGAEEIARFRSACDARLAALRRAGAAAQAPALDPDRENALRALGYIR